MRGYDVDAEWYETPADQDTVPVETEAMIVVRACVLPCYMLPPLCVPFFSALRPRVNIDRGRHNPCNRQRPVQLYLTIGCTAEVLPGRFNDIQLNLALTTG